MELQSLFRRFDEAILLKRYEENAELREKRDRIVKRLQVNLKTPFEWFNQGSYAMGTGIKPVKDDYDIDIGVAFTIDHAKHDPVEVKRWVYNAVSEHTTRVDWRRPCITVNYMQDGQVIYHVDLAVMAKEKSVWGDETYRLAIGKESSSKDQREWQPDDRKGFMKAVAEKLSGEDAAQFRRVIRYLKRWKDVHFVREGHAAPTGLALTVAANSWFQTNKSGGFLGPAEYDDLAATFSLVRSMRDGFQSVPETGGYVQRLVLKFPKEPHDDVLGKMPSQKMKEFRERLDTLLGWLNDAKREQSSAPLRLAFGGDFPEK